MTGLTTIKNDLYVSPISLILTAVDGTYREFHVSSAIMSSIKKRDVDQVRRLLIFSIK